MCWKRGAPGRRGSGSPFLACTNRFCPAPILVQGVSRVFTSPVSRYWYVWRCNIQEGHPWRAQTLKIWKISVRACSPGWIFLLFFVLCCLMMNLPSMELLFVEIWRWNGVHWTLWFILSLVEGLFKDAKSFWKRHPRMQLHFHSHSFMRRRVHFGGVLLSYSDESFLSVIQSPGVLFGF